MSFADVRQHVLENVHLSTDFFAEVATYAPMHGASRSVHAHVRQRRQVSTQQGTRDEDEVIEVLVGRDPTNEDIGGIDRPQSGDRFIRPADRDPDCRPYSFTGEVADVSPHKWRLTFRRRRRSIQGRGV